MKAYVVVEVDNVDDPIPYIVGIFSGKTKAFKTAERLFKKYGEYCSYIVQDYEVNKVYLNEQSQEEILKETSEAIEIMVKEGILDYKIGEDGDFYFEVTEKGKKEIN
jgi:hypothetical protein